MKKKIIHFCFLLLVLVFPHKVGALEPGDIAKDFALRDKRGAIVTLSSLREGADATVLELISIYCDACKKKVPRINALLDKYEEGRVKIIAVALANEGPEIEAETSKWNARYPILPDPDKTTLHLYGAHNVPHIYVIDKSNVIRYSGNGDDLAEIERMIDKLIAGTSAPAQEGDAAPEISLKDLHGKLTTIDVFQHSAGTILGFFKDDGRQSRRQAKFLKNLADELSDVPGAVYALIPDSFKGDPRKITKEFYERIPVLLDANGLIFRQYAVDASEIILVSGSGRIRKRNCPPDVKFMLNLIRQPQPVTAPDVQSRMASALKRALPDALTIKPVSVADATIYVATHESGEKSYARLVHKDILCEVCTDIAFVQVIDQEGLYKAFELVMPFESYGKQVDATAFLRQFIGKSYHHPFVAGANADTVTGATKSSLKFIEALNENERIFSQFIDDPSFDATFRRQVCFLEQAEIEHALLLYSRDRHKQPNSIEDAATYCTDGKLPVCPGGGSYLITVFNDIPRVMCTVHGLDPQSSMIH